MEVVVVPTLKQAACQFEHRSLGTGLQTRATGGTGLRIRCRLGSMGTILADGILDRLEHNGRQIALWSARGGRAPIRAYSATTSTTCFYASNTCGATVAGIAQLNFNAGKQGGHKAAVHLLVVVN